MAKEIQSYFVRNKERLVPIEPLRSSEYYEFKEVEKRIHTAMTDRNSHQGASFIFTPKDSKKVIGNINFTNFIFGVFQACHLGFSIDKDFEGKGIMHEALTATLHHIREEYGLHRIMANHLPTNKRSGYLLKTVGFVKEGYAKSYLKINGVWQDHVLNSLVFDD